MLNLPSTLNNVRLADLMPSGIMSDPVIFSLCAAIDAINQFVTDATPRVIVLADIGNQSSDVTDLLAFEQRTPYYDQTLPLSIRQSLLANTGHVNSIMGTKLQLRKLQLLFLEVVRLRNGFNMAETRITLELMSMQVCRALRMLN